MDSLKVRTCILGDTNYPIAASCNQAQTANIFSRFMLFAKPFHLRWKRESSNRARDVFMGQGALVLLGELNHFHMPFQRFKKDENTLLFRF